MSRRITAILVTYNSAQEIGAALAALQPLHESGEIACIVVDNASVDGTIAAVRAHPWVELIPSESNLGYGRGLNLGLGRVTTPYVLFMNPDATIDPADLNRLCQFLETHSRAGMVAPAIVEGGGSLQMAGRLPTPWLIVAQAAGFRAFTRAQRPIQPGAVPFKTDWLGGALLLARTRLMRDLGGFDPRFFLYFEETDLCRRVLRAGYELWAVGEAVAFHHGSVSAKKSGQPLYASCIAEHYFRSRFYYLRKHYGWLGAVMAETGEYVALQLRALACFVLRRGHDGGRAARLAGPFFAEPARVTRQGGSHSQVDSTRTHGRGR